MSQKEERGVDDQSAGGYESDPAETDDSEPDTEEEHGDVLYMDENAWETTQRDDLETTQCDELDVTQRDDYDEASEDEHSRYVVKVTGSPHCGMLRQRCILNLGRELCQTITESGPKPQLTST